MHRYEVPENGDEFPDRRYEYPEREEVRDLTPYHPQVRQHALEVPERGYEEPERQPVPVRDPQRSHQEIILMREEAKELMEIKASACKDSSVGICSLKFTEEMFQQMPTDFEDEDLSLQVSDETAEGLFSLDDFDQEIRVDPERGGGLPPRKESPVKNLRPEIPRVQDGSSSYSRGEVAPPLQKKVSEEQQVMHKRPDYPMASRENPSVKLPSHVPKSCKPVCQQYNGGKQFQCDGYLSDKRFKQLWKRYKLMIRCHKCQVACLGIQVYWG